MPSLHAAVTFATYNIHAGHRFLHTFDARRVAAAIAETGADVIALQEVGRIEGDRARDPLTAIADLLGYGVVAFAPNVVWRGGRYRYGNAILSRYPIASWENHDLSVPGRIGTALAAHGWTVRPEPRGCLLARIELPGVDLLAGSAHLGLLHGERARQAAHLVDAVLEGERRPTVLGGDFNDWFRGRDTRALRARYQDAALLDRRAATYPARFPLFRVDHVYVSRDVRVVHCRPLRRGPARTASDHLPLVARLELPCYGAGDACDSLPTTTKR